MRVVILADVDKVIEDRINKILTDPATKQSTFAKEVGNWGVEILNMLKSDIAEKAFTIRRGVY